MTQQTAIGSVPALTLGWRMKMALGEMSVQQMAEILGVSRNTVSRWMADKGSPPKLAYVRQWAFATGIDFDWLSTGQLPDGPQGPKGGGNEVTVEYLPFPPRSVTLNQSRTSTVTNLRLSHQAA